MTESKQISVMIQKYCYVEECADSDSFGLITDLQLTNPTVEMDYAIGVAWLEIVIYINKSDKRSDERSVRNRREM